MSTINRESTTDAPAPTTRQSENLLVQDGIRQTAIGIIAKSIYDLYCLETTRQLYSRNPPPSIEDWVKDPRFAGIIAPYADVDFVEYIVELINQVRK